MSEFNIILCDSFYMKYKETKTEKKHSIVYLLPRKKIYLIFQFELCYYILGSRLWFSKNKFLL